MIPSATMSLSKPSVQISGPELKQETSKLPFPVAPFQPDMRTKIDLYRRLARLTTEAAVGDFAAELADRFGPLPEVVAHLLELARLRIWAHGWGVREIRLEDRYAVLGYTSRDQLSRLVKRSGGQLRVADAVSAYLPLSCELDDSAAVFAEVKALLQPAGKAA